MPDDPFANLYPAPETAARQAAREMINTLVSNAASPDDVPVLIEQVIAWMRDEWEIIDWHHYAEDFGLVYGID